MYARTHSYMYVDTLMYFVVGNKECLVCVYSLPLSDYQLLGTLSNYHDSIVS